jgi:hydroxymethylglutaryl-CoA reductase
MTSELSGFYRLGLRARRAEIAEIADLTEEELLVLSGELGLRDVHADRMVENALGVLGVPLGVCVNLTIDGEDILVPMAIEEPSVIAASSHAAKLVRAGGGLRTEVSDPHMIGQVQILEVADHDDAARAILDAKQELIALANSHHKSLVAAGGGAFDVEVRRLDPMSENDPLGTMLVVHLIADVRDAMGANAINSMCERLAPRLAELSGGRVGLRILSNLNDRRTVKVEGAVPFAALEHKGAVSGEKLAHQIQEASVFAERDPYRAATHNKGIMNGVDAVLLAFGQDWRAVEAGAHSFVARFGRYTALARWRVEGDRLVGRMEIPMAVGTVGGVAKVHPTVQITRRISAIENASQLARIAASVGLVQNLGALRALAAEGIQSGHMRLHARNVAVEAGADGDEVGEVARIIADGRQINLEAAKAALCTLRGGSLEPEALGDVMECFDRLAAEHMPAIMKLISEVVAASNPNGSTLGSMLDYHLETGGKRLRALTPLLVAEAFGKNPAELIALGATCEMLHNATLVHDDLQDGDTTRRGRPTIWAQYGMPQAVNLGDAMFYYTILLSQRLEIPSVKREAIAHRVLVDTLRVIDGQEKEFALKKAERISLEDYFRMVEGKTSGLFALPMAGAAEVLGMGRDVVEGLAEAARQLGVVFQIQDDVLDLYGDKGRDMRGSDIGEGKRSALVVHAMEHATERDREWLLHVLDKPREETSQQDVRDVMALFERTASLDYALDEITRRKNAALAVPALQDHPRVIELIGGLCELFLKPIASLYESKDSVVSLFTDPQDLAFCHRILPEVSRTFALSIHALPESLRNAVAVSYLLCRIVDTIEDEAEIDPQERVRLFDQFDRTMIADDVAPSILEEMGGHLGVLDAEKDLMTNAGAVFRSFRRLEKHQRDAIRPHVLEMSMGMREYTARADAVGKLVLRDLDDLERYCYFVAGTVGNLLTALFEHTVPVLKESVRTAIRDRAVSFGLGLQMVNIVKDVAIDFERGDVFLPEATAKEMGVELSDLLAPQKRQEALRLVRAVCARARKHLEKAAEYTQLWPAPQGVPVRQFCAVPLALALASLVEVENGRDTLRPGRVPKITRELVMSLFQDVADSVENDEALMALFERCVSRAEHVAEIEVHVPARPPGRSHARWRRSLASKLTSDGASKGARW